jgi:hypothetical protein
MHSLNKKSLSPIALLRKGFFFGVLPSIVINFLRFQQDCSPILSLPISKAGDYFANEYRGWLFLKQNRLINLAKANSFFFLSPFVLFKVRRRPIKGRVTYK